MAKAPLGKHEKVKEKMAQTCGFPTIGLRPMTIGISETTKRTAELTQTKQQETKRPDVSDFHINNIVMTSS